MEYLILGFGGWIFRFSIREGLLSSPYYPRKIQYLWEIRNKLLQATDYYLLPDVVIDEIFS